MIGASPEPTLTVSELAGQIAALLEEVFPPVWVTGEVQRARPSARGHLYFELVEKGQGDDVVAKLDAVIWRSDHERIRRELAATGQALVEGVELRALAQLSFYPPSGRLQIVVRQVDPSFSLGQLERRRRELLAELTASGLAERNRALAFPDLPLDVALVTSEGSAAYHDFLHTLGESPYGFRVVFVHSAVQGKEAERQLVSALEAAGRLAVDCVVLIRGGGSRSDLAVFDSRAVALAVATCPLPVVTGLGHEIDLSIVDQVAHTAVKTPTKAAELLVDRAAQAEAALDTLGRELARVARVPLAEGREALSRLSSRLSLCGRRVTAAALRLSALGRALGPAARGRLRTAELILGGLERLSRGLAPERILARGFSITRSAEGRAIRRPEEVAAGERITSETAGGTLASRVEAT